MKEVSKILSVPAEHPSYAGHFPGNPIVPGALLLQWLQVSVEQSLPGWNVVEAPSAKFLAEVKPGNQLNISARFDEETGRLRLAADGVSGLACKVTLLLKKTGHC